MLRSRVGDTVDLALIVVDEMASCAGVGVVERSVQSCVRGTYYFLCFTYSVG